MTAQTTTQRTAAHRRRMAEKMARYEGALERIAASERAAGIYDTLGNAHIASEALNPTDPAKS